MADLKIDLMQFTKEELIQKIHAYKGMMNKVSTRNIMFQAEINFLNRKLKRLERRIQILEYRPWKN